MSRPETFTLRCDRCGHEMTHRYVHDREEGDADDDGHEPIFYTSHRQATLDGLAAGWRMTSLEEVCKACVAKESEQTLGGLLDEVATRTDALAAAMFGPGGTSDD